MANTDAQWAAMTKLVQQMMQRGDAEPFRVPVDWKLLGLYDYPQIIKKPMDLGTVKKKIADGKYKTIANAADDVRLVWTNCMTYNADGSDFYNLAKNLNKKWEEKYSKLVADLKLGPTPMGGVLAGVDGSKISLDEKRAFAKSLYKISKEDLGKIIVEIDTKCPPAIVKNAGEDECELNIDKISPALFQELKQFVANCIGKGGAAKKKSASGTKRKST